MDTGKGWKLAGAPAMAMLCTALAAQVPLAHAQSGAAGQTAGQSGQMTGSRASGATLSRADQNLIKDMAQANLTEIQAGKLAQQKTRNEQVRKFAQKMIDDHTKALQEVQQLAQSKGVDLPTEPDWQHRKMAERLGALSGDAFDRRYMSQAGVDDHKQTHKLLERVQSRARDADIKALASKMMPTVEQHLNEGQQLNAARGRSTGETSSGASGTGGTTGGSGTGGPAGTGGSSGGEGKRY